MVDVVDKATRSRMMSGIRSGNTKPEQIIRKALHARGFRYKIHDRKLPGVPDVVFPKYRSVVFIHGCFWHGHQCRYFKWPASNRSFWRKKIETNITRDITVRKLFRKSGWRVLVLWECATKGKDRRKFDHLIDKVESWLLMAE